MKETRSIFFGTPKFATIILDELEKAGLIPALVVTAPDRPQGRGLVLTQSDVKVWALAHGVPVLTPEKIRDNEGFLSEIKKVGAEFFVVAAYGKIIPKALLDIPSHGTLNVHPSLLPKFRGASPIESAILSDEKETGVTIMLLDEEMDHGPILAQRTGVPLDPRPKGTELTSLLASLGGKLLAETIPRWLEGGITATDQEHDKATFTKKISKADGEIQLGGDPLMNYKKFRAFDEWPGAYFFIEREDKKVRIKIADAILDNGEFKILRVIPEGKKEVAYSDILRGATAP